MRAIHIACVFLLVWTLLTSCDAYISQPCNISSQCDQCEYCNLNHQCGNLRDCVLFDNAVDCGPCPDWNQTLCSADGLCNAEEVVCPGDRECLDWFNYTSGCNVTSQAGRCYQPCAVDSDCDSNYDFCAYIEIATGILSTPRCMPRTYCGESYAAPNCSCPSGALENTGMACLHSLSFPNVWPLNCGEDYTCTELEEPADNTYCEYQAGYSCTYSHWDTIFQVGTVVSVICLLVTVVMWIFSWRDSRKEEEDNTFIILPLFRTLLARFAFGLLCNTAVLVALNPNIGGLLVLVEDENTVMLLNFSWTLNVVCSSLALPSLSTSAVRVVSTAHLSIGLIVLALICLSDEITGVGIYLQIVSNFLYSVYYGWLLFGCPATPLRATVRPLFMFAMITEFFAWVPSLLILADYQSAMSFQGADLLWLMTSFQVLNVTLYCISPLMIAAAFVRETNFWRLGAGGLFRSRSDSSLLGKTISERIASINSDTMSSQSSHQKLLPDTVMFDLHDVLYDVGASKLVHFNKLNVDETKVLGQGASACVYRGQLLASRNKQVPVAVKVLKNAEVTIELVKDYIKETNICCLLEHVNIVQFYGLCVAPPDLSLVYELCERGALTTNLRLIATFERSEKIRIMRDCATAVSYIHSLSPQIIHRDIKPDNFLLDTNFIPKLADFGLSRLLEATDRTTTLKTGSPLWMAPEMIRRLDGKNNAPYSDRIDIYSLGVMFYQIYTGIEDPFPHLRFSHQIFDAVVTGERPKFPSWAADGDEKSIDLKVQDLIEHMWYPTANLRPSANQCLKILDELMNGVMPDEHKT